MPPSCFNTFNSFNRNKSQRFMCVVGHTSNPRFLGFPGTPHGRRRSLTGGMRFLIRSTAFRVP